MNIKKTSTSVALIAFIAISSMPLNAGIKDSVSNFFTNTNTLVKPYYEKVINCPYLMESLAGASLLYCNYSSYCDYHQLTLIPKEDRIEAAKTIAVFVFKTALIGRNSYVNELDDHDYHGLVYELGHGYRDIVEGNTSFDLTESELKAFRLLCGFSLKTSFGFLGSLAFLYYIISQNKFILTRPTTP